MSANSVNGFSLTDTPLANGLTLLEASAGTGKTFALGGLFLRLLVEPLPGVDAPLDVERILVVTFTEAATEELRGRIRERVARAAEDFRRGESGDELVRALLARVPDREAAARRLESALQCFDLAAIFTIHGFCQRLLRDRAFEGGALFDVELVPDQSDLLRAAVEDFWRREFYDAPAWRAALADWAGVSASALRVLTARCLAFPDLELRSDAGARGVAEIEQAFNALRGRLAEAWRSERGALRGMFGSGTKFFNKDYKKDAVMDAAFEAVTRVVEGDGWTGSDLEALLLFCPTAFAKKGVIQAKASAPQHEFFDLVESLLGELRQWDGAIRVAAVRAAAERLREAKRERKVQSYDDLLTRLRDALASPSGAALARQVRAGFGAALIDEFQDTDPVQWEIFRRLFTQPGANEPAPALVLIGDPKQAIYGFRGADIHTYLRAAAMVPEERRFTLDRNWRSETPLVGAVNALFADAENPFADPGIAFHPVTAAGRAEETPLRIGGGRPAPLVFWFLERDEDGKPAGKAEARARMAQAVASEIVALLDGRAVIGAKPVTPGNIAVLVSSHAEASLVESALRAVNVPTVRHTQESVFRSAEARELARVLEAVAAPGDEALLRAALATGPFGLTASALHALESDAASWALWRGCFTAWAALWEERGFAVFFQTLLAATDARARLLALPAGERALTNLLHLGELLQEAALSEGLGAGALRRRLAERITGDESAAEAHLLRLERDDQAVRLVTIHTSKGLEYDIVLCPFCWRSAAPAKNASRRKWEVLFHDAAAARRVRDLGPEFGAGNPARAQAERMAENLRLLYVALTRARRRCYVAWGAVNDTETSAPAWLLHHSRGAADADGAWRLDFESAGDAELRADIAARSAELISVEAPPEPDGAVFAGGADNAAAGLAARTFTRALPDDWRIVAFTQLTKGAEEEAPDHDGGGPPAPVTPAEGFAAFPGGTWAGTCLHKIFERLDFTRATTDAAAVVEAGLRAHGFNVAQHAEAVKAKVRETLATPLGAGRGTLKLETLPDADRLNELEFAFPLRPVTADALAGVLRRHGAQAGAAGGDFPQRIGRLRFDLGGGFVKGYMDLVFRHGGKFHLLDWKSNWLGPRPEDYAPERLAVAMRARWYPLQYLLYTVALKAWLERRVPGFDYERDFGGVHYIFLRGITPGRPELGVFTERPARELIEDLGALLIAPTSGGES